MQKKDVVVGEEYAVREPPKEGVELQHVRVLENVRGSKWRVEWIDPNPGLVDYIESRQIVTPWRQRA